MFAIRDIPIDSDNYREIKMISVIIPCYNAEYTIDRAMISLERQTIGIENLDIWLIDDCSTDYTEEKIHFWHTKYPNVNIVSFFENSLQGLCRNYGIKQARGDYLTFLDADDWLAPDAYEKAYNKAKEYDADIVKYLFCVAMSEGVKAPKREKEDEFIEFHNDRFDRFESMDYERSCWNKLYKISFVREHKLRFSVGTYDEESLFTTPAYLNANRVYLLNEYLYYYYYNNNGATQSMTNSMKHGRDNAKVWLEVYEKCKEDGTLGKEHNLIEWLFAVNYYYYSINLAKDRGIPYTDKEVEDMRDTVKRLFPDCNENKALKKLGITI